MIRPKIWIAAVRLSCPQSFFQFKDLFACANTDKLHLDSCMDLSPGVCICGRLVSCLFALKPNVKEEQNCVGWKGSESLWAVFSPHQTMKFLFLYFKLLWPPGCRWKWKQKPLSSLCLFFQQVCQNAFRFLNCSEPQVFGDSALLRAEGAARRTWCQCSNKKDSQSLWKEIFPSLCSPLSLYFMLMTSQRTNGCWPSITPMNLP